MHALDHKIPPVLQVIFLGCMMWLVSPLLPTVNIEQSWASLLAITVLVVGVVLAGAGVREFTRHKTTVDPLAPQKASALVVSGVYTYTRNPMYAGFALSLCALVIYLRSPLLLSGVIVFIAYMNRFQINPEERALSAAFGGEWERYRSRVRRWL